MTGTAGIMASSSPIGKKRFVKRTPTKGYDEAPIRAELKVPLYQDHKHGEKGQPTTLKACTR